jgi:acetyltransferase-like isoleucine patch superfamily enzyme
MKCRSNRDWLLREGALFNELTAEAKIMGRAKKLFFRIVVRPAVRLCVRIYYRNLAAMIASAESEFFATRVYDFTRLHGEGLRINGRITITHFNMLVVGTNVHIGRNAYFHTAGGLTIGDNTHISRNVTIYTAQHRYEGTALPYDDTFLYDPVFIGRNVWIGMNVSIVPGVTIGDGAIIGMGTVVSRNVGPGEIVGNARMRVLKDREKERYQSLENSGIYGGVDGEPLRRKNIRFFGETCAQKKDKLFFIVGTGRCGTSSIAKTLTQHPNIICWHEPNFQLVRLSPAFAHHRMTREAVQNALRFIYTKTSVFPTGFYGESDQKLSNLIEILNELFPNAQFLWLIRNAPDTVDSMYSRGWYSDRERRLIKFGYDEDPSEPWRKFYAENRPNGAQIGVMSEVEWEGMPAFERNCWYWSYWNSLIEKQLLNIDKKRWMMIQLEEMGSRMKEVNERLGVADFEYTILQSNKAMKTHRLISVKDWGAVETEAYERWCGELMKKWYAGSVFNPSQADDRKKYVAEPSDAKIAKA